MLWYLVARGRLAACCYRGMVIDASLNWSSCRKTKECRSVIADDARAFSLPGSTWRGCYSKETTADWRDLKLKECTSVTEGPLSFYETLLQLYLCAQWRTKGRLGGGSTPPPPKFRSFDKVEPDCKLSGKCLVFLFQHPNYFKNFWI
jgi:hypothetical protein